MKSYLKYFLVMAVTLGITAGGITFASWGGFSETLNPVEFAQKHLEIISERAKMFGISAEQAKQYWVEGKTMNEIAETVGLSKEDLKAKMQANRQERMQEHMQILVDGGVLTQEQADQRMETMQNREGRMFGNRGGKRMGSGDCRCNQ